MNITIADMSGDVDLDEHAPQVSVHTGRTLRNGTVRVRIGREHDGLMAALPGRVLESDEGSWLVVRRPQFSYREGARTAEHVFEIEEFENRGVTMLRIADLELKPERYCEDASGGHGLEVTARVALTDPQQIERLREILSAREPVPVVREGVQDAPREMNVEVLGWSQRDAEYVFELECSDPEQVSPLELNSLHSAVGRASEIAFLRAWREAFVDLLLDKGVVSKKELEDVFASAAKNVGREMFSFGEVADVRTHPFKGESAE